MALYVQNLESGFARTAWTGSPADYNIANNDPMAGKALGLAGGATPEGRPCRRLVVLGSGTLVYTGVDGVAVTLPAAGAAFAFDVQAISLTASGSTATNVVVIW